MQHNPFPPLNLFQEVLIYDPETGYFTWRTSRPGVSAGCRAGSLLTHGYRYITCVGGQWRENRLAWYMMTGVDPADGEVDHINRVRDDNRWANLRLVCRSVNSLHTGTRSKSGVRGVWRKNDRFWGARLSYRGESVLYRQDFETFEEAVAARYAAEVSVGLREP